MTDTFSSTSEIERDVEKSRARVSGTLNEIRERMSPGQLMDEALGYFRSSGGGEFARNLGRSVTDNPLPLVLVGTGLAWLMSSTNGSSRLGSGPSRRPAGEGRDNEFSASEFSGSDMADSVKDATQATVDRVRGAAQSVSDTASGYAQGAKELAVSASTNAQNLGDQVHRTWNTLAQDQPLVLGAIGLALGALLGAGLPGTQAEDRLMGDASDGLKSKVKEKLPLQDDDARDASSFREDEEASGTRLGSESSTAEKGRVETRPQNQ